MKKLFLLVTLIAALAVSACEMESNNANNNSAPANGNAKPEVAAADPSAPVLFPFAEFAHVETTAKAGEFVLSPAIEGIRDGVNKGKEGIYTFNRQKLVAPDKDSSEVDFTNSKVKVPNAFIVPLPAGQKAQNGDLVLTWVSPSASMTRAIVVDAATPSEPVVRYLDVDYDLAEKGSDGKTNIGQSNEKLKADSFVKLSDPFDPGMTVAIKAGPDMKHATVIHVAGDKVLAKNWAGSLEVVDKKDCQPVPFIPRVKAGDKVKAERMGKYVDATVTRIDSKIGRVFVRFEGSSDEKAIAFGNVLQK